MLKAVVQNGSIVPLEPLPADWRNGTELSVEQAQDESATPDEIDRWFEELERLCANADPEDAARIDAAVREADKLAKAHVRREMGLPE
jgi:hypothetical protein